MRLMQYRQCDHLVYAGDTRDNRIFIAALGATNQLDVLQDHVREAAFPIEVISTNRTSFSATVAARIQLLLVCHKVIPSTKELLHENQSLAAPCRHGPHRNQKSTICSLEGENDN